MIKGIGIDIIEIDRINALLLRQPRTVDKLLSEREKELYLLKKNQRSKCEFLSGRFAAKEAFSKAIGSGIGKVSFKDIEVLSTGTGQPEIHYSHDQTYVTHVSISHSESYAVAQVVLEQS
ncbi:holo-[acyl-carrier protein] synthase [Pelagirhabdus alkalitolerans]|uniref:Holo-[acyl-carrier-protein] synthase n=1 Tax=Pelagirhabdus alkalitolerans TaxID=1612202 RepID=A0A1G6JF85_9BACI|nr:holo-ACP synthase [Pelagirhabdus alkalitolerans]SDC17378.1 holo-[acyl-carrier protein] synthase [Pelagirhabdus alkalitolerans]